MTEKLMEQIEEYSCSGCGIKLSKDDIEPYVESFCHVIVVQIDEDEWEPQPCGPILLNGVELAKS